MRGFRWTLLGLGLCVTACSARVAGGLGESDANEVVAALDRAGIAADKRSEGGGAESRFAVEVERGELGAALRVLEDSALPRRVDPGIAETYAEPSLVPSSNEERARYHAAIAGELASTLERIDGVLDARVHLGLPEPRDLPIEGAPAGARASVLLEVRRGAHVDHAGVRALVAGAVDGLPESAVSVVVVQTGAAERGPRWRSVGPFRVAPGSSVPLASTLATSILLHIATAIVLILLVRRGGRRDEAREAAG